MLELTLYPKTPRIGMEEMYTITEKLDGSNLGLFELDGETRIAQRNRVYKVDEIGDWAYKGLKGRIEENKNSLNIQPGSCVFGERMEMGRLSYGQRLDKKFYIFAKANVEYKEGELIIKNINYNRDLFMYSFYFRKIPDSIGIVPLVAVTGEVSIQSLNRLYDQYMTSIEGPCEGFVVSKGDYAEKYVRNKRGKIEPHKA